MYNYNLIKKIKKNKKPPTIAKSFRSTCHYDNYITISSFAKTHLQYNPFYFKETLPPIQSPRRRRHQIMSRRPHAPPRPLYKQQSWSPDTLREEAWQRRRDNHVSSSRHRLSKSLSEDDLQELKACIELGFGFDSPEIDPKLSNTIPALELYHAVNTQYNNHSLSRSSSASSLVSDSDTASPTTIFNPADDLVANKTRLKQWAQVVGWAVRQSQSSPSSCSHPSDHIN